MRILLLAALGVVCSSAVVFANDTAIGAVGGVLRPMDAHPSVRMVSEDVRIKPIDGYLRVHCRFVFQNKGGPVTVKMGFPEDRGTEISGFDYFRARVDGRPAPVRRVSGKKDAHGAGRDWWVKEVSFRRN